MKGVDSHNEMRRSFAMYAMVVAFVFLWQFHAGNYDNAASRLDLSYSLALHKTVSIDRYAANTIDKALYRGHYYSDKAPGLSLAAVPVIKALSLLSPGEKWSPDNPAASWIVVALTVGFISIAGMYCMFMISSYHSGDGDIFPIVVYALGSLALPYSTMFYSHQFCAALLAMAFFMCHREYAGIDRPSFARGAVLGFIAALTSVSEYPTVVPAFIFVAASSARSRKLAHIAGIVAGAAVPTFIFMWHNYSAFGNPFHIGYMYEVNEWFKTEMSRGAGGVTYPRPDALAKLLFAPQRGLFWGCPFLLLVFPGAAALWKRGGSARFAAVAASTVSIILILVNASYYEPYGGFSPGPRFLVPALPFMVILSAAGWSALKGLARGFFAGAGLFSILNFVIINSADPHVPHVFKSPLLDFAIPLFSAGYQAHAAPVVGVVSNTLYFIAIAIVVLPLFITIFLNKSDKAHFFEEGCGLAIGFLLCVSIVLASGKSAGNNGAMESYYMGAAMNVNRQYDRAAEFFNNAVVLNPDFSQAWLSLGISEMKIAQYDIVKYNKAIASIEESVRLNPDLLQGHISSAAANLTISRFEEARRAAERGLERFPGNPELLDLKRISEEMVKKTTDDK